MNKGRLYIFAAGLTAAACAGLLFNSASYTENTQASDAPAVSASSVTDEHVLTMASAASFGSILDTSDIFTQRDQLQTADLSSAQYLTVSDNEDIHITQEGVYVISGSASNTTIYVEADKEDKVQLVLDGLNIENESFPCIYVTGADKVFVTTASDSSLSVTDEFEKDESTDTSTDGVIYSKKDLVLNGTATLRIYSTDIGVVCKDDLKITGGTYEITARTKAFEAKDSVLVSDGTFNLKAGTDGIHAENKDDDSKGYIYICGGTFTIDAGDDALHGESVVQIDSGTFNITASEGIESTYVQINGGEIFIYSTDDGINAGYKSGSYFPTIEINGGNLSIEMTAGDTDGIDSNGDLIINGGTVNITGPSAFDCDGTATYNGGTLIINGVEYDTIPFMQPGARGANKGANKGR